MLSIFPEESPTGVRSPTVAGVDVGWIGLGFADRFNIEQRDCTIDHSGHSFGFAQGGLICLYRAAG